MQTNRLTVKIVNQNFHFKLCLAKAIHNLKQIKIS